jgi:hypothetical protein
LKTSVYLSLRGPSGTAGGGMAGDLWWMPANTIQHHRRVDRNTTGSGLAAVIRKYGLTE